MKRDRGLHLGALVLWASLMILTVASDAYVQEIYVSEVTGTLSPGRVKPGEVVRVRINFRNTTPSHVTGLRYGFNIKATGDADWDSLFVERPAYLGTSQYFDFVRQTQVFDDSLPPDTTVLTLTTIFADGFPPGFDNELLSISIGPVSGSDGGAIIVDSLTNWVTPTWTFPNIVQLDDTIDVQIGFEADTVVIADCCAGEVGDVSADGEVTLDDVAHLVESLFVSYEDPPCFEEADVHRSDRGRLYLTDVSRLVNHLFITFEPLPACP